MSTQWKLLALLAGLALVAVAGCGDTADLKKQVSELKEENKVLKDQVEKLSKELRPLLSTVDRLDVGHRNMEKTIAQAREDLESRVTELVQQEMSGGRGRRPFFPQPAPAARLLEKPYMGFDAQDIEPDVAKLLNLKAKTGVLVTEVREGSPAAVAGLQKNDVVGGLDGEEVKNFQDLKRAMEAKKPNEVVTLKLQRGDEKLELKVTLGTRRVPADQ